MDPSLWQEFREAGPWAVLVVVILTVCVGAIATLFVWLRGEVARSRKAQQAVVEKSLAEYTGRIAQLEKRTRAQDAYIRMQLNEMRLQTLKALQDNTASNTQLVTLISGLINERE